MALFHPFYVSVTEIRHNAAQQELEVSCRIFADDFENALKKQYHTSFDIIHPANRRQVDSLIAGYLRRHLQVSTNGKTAALSYMGYQVEEDAVWCFLSAKKIPAPKQVQVHNDVLYEAHPTQSHMIHVTVNGTRRSTKLDNPKADATFTF